MKTYSAKPNGGVDRVIAYLGTLPYGAEVMSAPLCEAAHIPRHGLETMMEVAVANKVLFRRKKGGFVRSPLFWSLVDHDAKTIAPGTFPPSVFDVQNPAAAPVQVAPRVVPEGSGVRVRTRYDPFNLNMDSLTGKAILPAKGSQTPDGDAKESPAKAGQDTREGDVAGDARQCVEPVAKAAQATAVGDEGTAAHADERAAEPDQIHDGRDAQHVLKAEAARPDATDRVDPATTSPRVGAMGAGEPADAGPAAMPQVFGCDFASPDGADAFGYLVEGWLRRHPPRLREPIFAMRSDARLWMQLEDGAEHTLTAEATRALLEYIATWAKP